MPLPEVQIDPVRLGRPRSWRGPRRLSGRSRTGERPCRDKPAVRKRTTDVEPPVARCSAGSPAPDATPRRPTDTAVPRLPRVYVPRTRLWARLEDATSERRHARGRSRGRRQDARCRRLAACDRPGSRTTTWIHADADLVARAGWRACSRTGPQARAAAATAGDRRRPPAADRHPAAARRSAQQRPRDPAARAAARRWDLPLTRLVPELMGHFSILRGDVLRMDDEECVPLVAEHARTDHPEVMRSVIDQSHGWVAAVVLASRAHRRRAGRRGGRASLRRGRRRASPTGSPARSSPRCSPRERHLLLCVANEEVVTTEDGGAPHPRRPGRRDPRRARDDRPARQPARRRPGRTPESDALPHPPPAHRGRTPTAGRRRRRRRPGAGHDPACRAARPGPGRDRPRLPSPGRGQRARRGGAACWPRKASRIAHARRTAPAIAGVRAAHPDIVESAPGHVVRARPGAVAGQRRQRLPGTGWTACWRRPRRPERADALCPRIACARLLRARMGAEPVVAAIGHARKVVLAHMRASDAGAVAAAPRRRARHGPGLARRPDRGRGQPDHRRPPQPRTRADPSDDGVPLPPGPHALHAGPRERLHRDRQRRARARRPSKAPDPDMSRPGPSSRGSSPMLCDVPWPSAAAGRATAARTNPSRCTSAIRSAGSGRGCATPGSP